MQFSTLMTIAIAVSSAGLLASLVLRRGAGQRRRGRLLGAAVAFGLVLLNLLVVLSAELPVVDGWLVNANGRSGALLWWAMIFALIAVFFVLPIVLLVALVQFFRGVLTQEDSTLAQEKPAASP